MTNSGSVHTSPRDELCPVKSLVCPPVGESVEVLLILPAVLHECFPAFCGALCYVMVCCAGAPGHTCGESSGCFKKALCTPHTTFATVL